MTVVEIRDGHAAPPAEQIRHQRTSLPERIRQVWLLCVIGIGLVATFAWMALLGWMLYQGIRILA